MRSAWPIKCDYPVARIAIPIHGLLLSRVCYGLFHGYRAETLWPFSQSGGMRYRFDAMQSDVLCLSRSETMPISSSLQYFTIATMSNQYDNIGEAYNIKKELTITLLQDANVEAVIKAYIRGARVLDLACGNGHHSRACIGWGASSVLGVDISSTMIDVARRSTTSEKIEFEVADCSKPKRYRGGEYDLVFAGWLLNYAPSGKDMANMFRNVALNLKDGGHFVVRTTRQNYVWLNYPVKLETQEGAVTHALLP